MLLQENMGTCFPRSFKKAPLVGKLLHDAIVKEGRPSLRSPSPRVSIYPIEIPSTSDLNAQPANHPSQRDEPRRAPSPSAAAAGHTGEDPGYPSTGSLEQGESALFTTSPTTERADESSSPILASLSTGSADGVDRGDVERDVSDLITGTGDAEREQREQRRLAVSKLKRAALLPRMKDGRRPPMNPEAVSEDEADDERDIDTPPPEILPGAPTETAVEEPRIRSRGSKDMKLKNRAPDNVGASPIRSSPARVASPPAPTAYSSRPPTPEYLSRSSPFTVPLQEKQTREDEEEEEEVLYPADSYHPRNAYDNEFDQISWVASPVPEIRMPIDTDDDEREEDDVVDEAEEEEEQYPPVAVDETSFLHFDPRSNPLPSPPDPRSPSPDPSSSLSDYPSTSESSSTMSSHYSFGGEGAIPGPFDVPAPTGSTSSKPPMAARLSGVEQWLAAQKKSSGPNGNTETPERPSLSTPSASTSSKLPTTLPGVKQWLISRKKSSAPNGNTATPERRDYFEADIPYPDALPKYQNAKLFPFPGLQKLQEERNRAKGMPTPSASTPDISTLFNGYETDGGNPPSSYSNMPAPTPQLRSRKLSHQASDPRILDKYAMPTSPASIDYFDAPASTGSTSSKPPMMLPGVKQWLAARKKSSAPNGNTATPERPLLSMSKKPSLSDLVLRKENSLGRDWEDVEIVPLSASESMFGEAATSRGNSNTATPERPSLSTSKKPSLSDFMLRMDKSLGRDWVDV
ncbi:hypothetical protein C8R45DRAFT_86495 [Mycena sanguinolenta]|nr:hypothetical protein C8R45DRAFT_86495 [Mycena sanguinolenta]